MPIKPNQIQEQEKIEVFYYFDRTDFVSLGSYNQVSTSSFVDMLV